MSNTFVDRIVNLRQPYIRTIVRGKAKAPVEFGIKLDISVVDGFAQLEKQSFDVYNEKESYWKKKLKDIVNAMAFIQNVCLPIRFTKIATISTFAKNMA